MVSEPKSNFLGNIILGQMQVKYGLQLLLISLPLPSGGGHVLFLVVVFVCVFFWRGAVQIPFSKPGHIRNSHLNESVKFPLPKVWPLILK